MTPDQAVILQQLINGLSLGMMYALLALGFTMVYGIIELINFAHFNVFMAGTFFGLWFLAFLGYGRTAVPLTGITLALVRRMRLLCLERHRHRVRADAVHQTVGRA